MARAIDITGQAFGDLVVLRKHDALSNGAARWLCQCSCGRQTISRGSRLMSGATQTCGCGSARSLIKHGCRKIPEYSIWKAMVRRCTIPVCKEFANYGGRGISVCERWMSVESFIADMGLRPSPQHSLDRINNDGNYEPANCRWATRCEQANNTRSNRMISFRGERKTLSQWQKATGLGHDVIRGRLRMGWSIEKALTTGAK